jgi:hypothetical protein
MIAKLIVECKRNVRRFCCVYIQDSIPQVLSWILATLVRGPLFNELGHPFRKLITGFNPSVLQNDVTMLVQLRSEKLTVKLHPWFHSQNVWDSLLIKTREDKILQFFWTIYFLLSQLVSFSNSERIEGALSIPEMA